MQQAISELEQAMEALRDERQRFHDVLNMLPVYVILLAPDYHVPLANRFFEERFGKAEGRRCYEYLFHRSEPCENCETFKVIKTHAPHRWEWTGPDGHDYDIYDFPFTDVDGSPLIMEMGIDVTDKKRAEAAARRERERLYEVMERLPAMICLLTPDYHVAFGNRSFRERFGESGGRHCYEQCFGRAEPCEFCESYRVLETGQPHHWEVTGPDGNSVFEAHDFPFTDVDGSSLILEMDIDVTAHKRAEAALKELNETLERRVAERTAALEQEIAERRRVEEALRVLLDERGRLLESERSARGETERANRLKDEFLANLSHELRTPLNAILGWTQILRRGQTNAEDIHKGLEVIERNTRIQVQLISDLLDLSRILSGKMRMETQDCDPAVVLEATIDSLAPAAEAKRIRVEKLIEPLSGPVLGDPDRLQQAFWNLLSNAIKFTPSGGRVQIVMRRTDSRIEIVFQDSGRGIGPDLLPHIFERFRQADSSTTKNHAGLGLGLSIAKHLVELHGGTVRAESPGENQGATFTITLPIIAIKRERDEPGGGQISVEDLGVAGITLNGFKVLIVDDEADTRDMVKRLLDERGATVAVADCAAQGVALLQELRPGVLIGDIGMPGEDGYGMIRRIRKLPPNAGGQTPAIALTAYSRMEDRTRAILAGYQYHLAKPVEAVELIATLGMISQGRPASS